MTLRGGPWFIIYYPGRIHQGVDKTFLEGNRPSMPIQVNLSGGVTANN